MPCFGLALLTQAFDDRREAIRVQLLRWMTQGKVIGLRRGTWMGTGKRWQPYLVSLPLFRHYFSVPCRTVELP
jgi:hypothetical protein